MAVKAGKGSKQKRRPLLVCLLPARNAESLLPDYLENVKQFADAVIALDDGSTDKTREILKASPQVAKLLVNKRRDSYLGWDDSQNRNRLLTAAAELNPHWVLQLDADERLDKSDAEALIDFLKKEAQPGYGYCLQSYRVDKDERFEPMAWNNFRLFAYEPGQRLEAARLAGNQIPTNIPPERWLITSIRIKHYHILDEGHEKRLQKYRQADPKGVFAGWYETLPKAMSRPYPKWQPRDPHKPYIIARAQRRPAAGYPPERLGILRDELAASKPETTFSRNTVGNLIAALDFEMGISGYLAHALNTVHEYLKTGKNQDQAKHALFGALGAYNEARGLIQKPPSSVAQPIPTKDGKKK